MYKTKSKLIQKPFERKISVRVWIEKMPQAFFLRFWTSMEVLFIQTIPKAKRNMSHNFKSMHTEWAKK